ncbi:hypothetical protein BGY98DRAFT_354258 [Russula aff. rugulosa BPL654]|nr:hypothetical protein BGY98DRAFT_354258 [Russula aff. rugulosa BPL654]
MGELPVCEPDEILVEVAVDVLELDWYGCWREESWGAQLFLVLELWRVCKRMSDMNEAPTRCGTVGVWSVVLWPEGARRVIRPFTYCTSHFRRPVAALRTYSDLPLITSISQQHFHNQRVCCDHQFTDRCSERESPTRPRSSPLWLDPQASPTALRPGPAPSNLTQHTSFVVQHPVTLRALAPRRQDGKRRVIRREDD